MMLHFANVIMFMYAMIIVCQLLHFEWWGSHNWVCIIVSLVYLLFLAAIDHASPGVSIFGERLQRLQDYAKYCEAPYFCNSWRNYFAPIRNGDYLVLSNEHYLKLDCLSAYKGKDIDLNRVYYMKVVLLDENEKIYEIEGDFFGSGDILDDLYRKIKDDGLDVEAIYNPFGDLKWKKCDKFKNASKARLYRLKIYQVIWPILQFIVAILPIVFILANSKMVFDD